MDIKFALFCIYIYIHILGKSSYFISKICSGALPLVRLGQTFPRTDGR